MGAYSIVVETVYVWLHFLCFARKVSLSISVYAGGDICAYLSNRFLGEVIFRPFTPANPFSEGTPVKVPGSNSVVGPNSCW